MKTQTTLFLGLTAVLWTVVVCAQTPATNAPPASAPTIAAKPAPAEAQPAPKPATTTPAPVAPTPAASVTPAVVTNVTPATAASTTPAAPARNIRFQFDGIPYMHAIERFAQMAGKPLVAESNLQGTISFNDAKAYTYQEALDMLNLMLSMKGMMLMEQNNYLQLVPFEQLPQQPLKILRGDDNTGDVRPGEVVTVLLEVNNLDAREFAESVKKMLSNAGSTAPLTKGRGLIVTDRLSNIQRIRYLLSQIDIAAAVDRQMKTYTLLHASGAIVADLLNRTFGAATAPKRTQFNAQTKVLDVLPPDPNDYITAVYDDASRTLVLFGPRERLALADEMINKFEEKGGGGGDVRIYFPQSIKTEELAAMIRQAVPGIAASGETAAAAATKARLIIDGQQNRLIVAAPIPGQLDAIESFINQIDKGAARSGGNVPIRSTTVQLTKVFRPRAAEVTNVAQILTQALTRRSPAGMVLTTASVSYEPNSQSIVVSGSPGDLEIATDIVSQLETGTTSPRPFQTKFIDVGGAAEAKRLQTLVEQLYRNQVSDGIGGQVAHAKIVADPDSGQLIVTASEEHLAKIEALVKSLRTDRAKPVQRPLQIVSFKHVRVDTVLKGVTDLVSERMNEKRFQDSSKPSLVADTANNRLLVTATDEQFKEIDQVIKLFDVAPEKAKRDMSLVPVQSKPAAEIITLVTQIMSQVVDEPLNPQLAPKLFPDPTGKQIIILASTTDLERITALIRQFDTATATAIARQFKGVDLFSRTAAELTPLVTQLYQEQIKGQPEPAGGPATLIAESKNNRIMVSGSEKEIARVEAVIRQLDPESKKPLKEETRIIRLKTASANDLLGLIEKSLNAQSQQVRVLVDQRSNSLVVTGEPDVVETAAQLIQQLDTRSTLSPREMRILELKHGQAAVLTPLLNNLFAETIKDQRGADYVPQTKIIADPAANRVIVTGPRDEITQVATLVEQLDATPEQTDGARVFKLNTADAATLAPVISTAMTKFDDYGRPLKRISVAADDKSNSLIVSGTRQDLQDASVMIEQLDGQAVSGGRGRTLKIIPIKAEDADSLATLATKIFADQNQGRSLAGQVTITPEPSGKRLIVMAPLTLMDQVETVVTSLDAKPDQVSRELQSIELKNATAPDLLPAVNKIYSEQNLGKLLRPATLYPDSSGSRLMVYGTREQAGQIRQIVETIETQKRVPREAKVFDMGKLAEAQRVLPLAQQLYKDQLASNPLAGTADAQMVSDGRTGHIIISARQDQLTLIEDIFTRLQTGVATNQVPRETRSFEVGNASDVQRLLPIVQQLYQDQWKDRIETDPADAQVVGDQRAGRIIATGKPDHLKQIEKILKELGVSLTPAVAPVGTNSVPVKAKNGARDTRIFDLTTANALELSTTVRTLYLDEARSRWGTIIPDTAITPDAGGNRIIVVGEPAELDSVEDLIKKLDKVSAQSASARVFKIKSADPTKVAEILTTALVRYDSYNRPQKRVTVSVDVKSRTLIATGDPKELQSVSVIIEQLDSSLGVQPERKMKVVSLEKGKVAELIPKVRQLYTDQLTSQPELGTTEILMLEDATSNQIILAGNDGQLMLVEKIIGELQAAQTVHGSRETKMIEIGQVDEMTRLMPLVQQLYTERWRDRAVGDPADAQIVSDARNARFIVTGRTNHLAEIEKIVNELRSADIGQPRDTRIYDLTTANAVDLAATVKSLYLDQSKNRPGVQAQDTSILPDVSANRLIVTATTNELAVVEEIIKKLDKVSAQSGTVRVFKLKSADPAKVMEILSNALTSYDSYGRPRRRVGVTLDAKTRTIIVAGDPKELQYLQNAAVIIEQLDTALGAQPERKIKVVALKTMKASETLPKLRQLYNDQLASQPDLATTDILIMEDAPSNQLILAGSDPQLKLLESIISDLQSAVVAQGPRETKILEAGAAEESARLQPLLQQLYQDQWKSKEAGDPPDAQIVSDSKTGRLIVTGRTNHLAEIEKIYLSLTAPQTNAEPRETRVYDLATTMAAELAASVKSIYQEQLKTRAAAPASQALIFPDTTANRLVVSGGTNELAVIEEIVQKLDKVEGQTGRTRVFKLKSAEAEQVSTILSSALVQITTYGRSVPRVTVGTDVQNNLLIVSGNPADLQAASVIVEQMDNMLAKEPRQMRVVPLKSGLASEVSTRVKQLYVDQLKGRPKTGAADAMVMGDDVSNRLIITASESHMKLLEEILSKLEEAGEGAGRQTRVLQLQRNSATSVAAMISQLFARQIASEDPGLRLVVAASTDDRTMVLDAAGPTLEKVEQLVHNLDGEGLTNAVEVRTYQVPDGDAAELAQSLTRLFAERAGPSTGGALTPRFEAEPKANVLMVAANRDQFERIGKLIEELKKTAAVANEIRTFVLKHGEPEQIANVLEDMLTESGGAPSSPYGPRRGRWRPGVGFTPATDNKTVRVSPASSLNAVVVQGPPEKLALADKLIQTLDKSDLDGKSVIQSVHLKKAHAEEIALAVNKTVAAKGANNRMQRVSVTAVAGANTLLLSGPDDAVQEVLKIIRELDVESESDEIEVRIYKLENGSAKEVSTIIQQLLQNVSRAQMRTRAATARAAFVPATVSVDEHGNSLIISATLAHFKVVEKILPTLDKLPERSERDVQFIWLKNAKATDVALKIESVFAGRPEVERPVVEGDSFANSVTVIAKRSDMAQIQDIIHRLDSAAKDTTIQVRLLPLDRVSAEQMAKMLENIYPQMAPGRIRMVDKLPPPKPPAATNEAAVSNQVQAPPEVIIAIDKSANALILSGPATELDQVDRIVTELSYNFISTDAEFRVFMLKEADPVIMARTLNDLFKQEQIQVPPQRPGEQPRVVQPAPKITVVAEPRTRSVIVRAKPQDFAVFEPLIKELDVGGLSAQLEFRMVPLTNAQPEKVLALVQQMVAQMNLVRPGEPLTVSVNPRDRGILVVARDSVLNQVEKMILSLDTPSLYAEAEVRVISLKKANATQLASILQNMLKPGDQGQVTPEARELQEQVRRLKVQNDQGQAVTLDLTKPIKIAADPLTAGTAGGNRLLLTSMPDNLKALAAIVEMMDSVPVLEGIDVKIVGLKHADATTVSQTLDTIFLQALRLTASPTPPGRGQPEGETGKALASPLNVAVDPRSNTLILSGRPESIELALRVIKDLDSQLERFLTEVKLFRLKHASAIRLLPMLQAVFAEGPAVPGSEGLSSMVTRLTTVPEDGKPRSSAQPKARQAIVMQADDLSNILIVAARTDVLPLIEEVINKLDIPAASGLDSLRVYVLEHADATALQKIINELHSGPRAAQMRTEDKPNVVVDERINALLVAGNTKSFAIIDGLIKQLDQKLPFDLRDVHIIALENADAATVAATIQRLMDARITQKATLNRQQADSLKTIVIADNRSNSLLVGGSKDSFELVEAIAKQLDNASPALSGRIRLVPLQQADARVIAATLTSLFTQRYAAARTPDVQRQRPIILPDPRSNSLLVAADNEDNKTLDDLLTKLDRKMDNPALTLTVIPLKHNDCVRVGTTIDAVFAARLKALTLPGATPAPSDTINVEPDPLNNAIIVSASKENFELIQELLQKIDAEPIIPGGVMETFVMQHADAQRVATMLRSLVQQGLYRPGGPAVSAATKAAQGAKDALAITVDPRSNILFVSASPENLVVVKEIIKRVDTKDFSTEGNVRLYVLTKTRASSIAAVLTQFFTAKRTSEAVAINAAERSIPVTVIPDDRVNALLVVGSKESFDIIDRLLPQLDGEYAFARVNFRVFPLKKATALKLQSTLQQIMANRQPRVRGEPVDPINIVADSWVNALLVGASAEDMPIVESLLEKLDVDATEIGISVHVFPLAKGDARRVATTVQSLFREGAPGTTMPVTVNADERMNAIIVSAGEADARRIGELVKKLDSDQIARVSEIKVFPLKYARAESLSTILTQALNTKPAALNEVNPNTQSVLQFISRTKDGQELVTAALKEGILITPDARMNSLIVSGPVDYMGLIEQIINHLDLSSPQQAKIKVFTLVNADARQMTELLMEMFRLRSTGGAATVSQRSIQYTLVREKVDELAEPGEEEEVASATMGTAEQNALTITVDPRTNSLLVGGTDHYVDLVSQIITALDACPANERKSQVIRMKHSQALEIATAIRTFLDQERLRVTQTLGSEAVGTAQRMLEREVSIVAEPGNNSLLVSANPRYFNEIRMMIEQLDQPQPQVLIQVLLAEVSLDGLSDIGVEWGFVGKRNNVDYGIGQDLGLVSSNFNVLDMLKSGKNSGFSSAITGGDFRILLKALESDGRLEVLSRPQIVTADNRPASINVGQKVPIVTDTRVSELNTTFNNFRYEDLGVTLSVTPRISEDGFVRMEVSTTNSGLSSSTLNTGNSSLPIINQRRAQTTVSVQSGQTIIIGGLIGTSDDLRIRGVPYLSKIPVVGALFRSTTKTMERKELLVLLTPQILINTRPSGPSLEMDMMTREQLDKSNLKSKIRRDELQREMLDPLYPELKNQPLDPKSKTNAPAKPLPSNPDKRSQTSTDSILVQN